MRFRGSIPCLDVPLSTSRLRPYRRLRMTRGQRGWLDLRCRTLSFPTPNRFKLVCSLTTQNARAAQPHPQAWGIKGAALAELGGVPSAARRGGAQKTSSMKHAAWEPTPPARRGSQAPLLTLGGEFSSSQVSKVPHYPARKSKPPGIRGIRVSLDRPARSFNISSEAINCRILGVPDEFQQKPELDRHRDVRAR